ncbi:MAG: 50S ribosomal protein L5 [Thermoplasmatota archaeon]
MSGPEQESGEGGRGGERGAGAAETAPSPEVQSGAKARVPAEAPGGADGAQGAAARTGNPMREPRIEKVVVNIGVGEGGEKLVKAEKVLMMITNQKAVRTISKTTNKDLGIRWGMPLGCKVTIRKRAAEEFLKTALWVKENKLTSYSFDPDGNFSFGISDYTDFPGQKYNPEIGIFGMDISVVMTRAGKRVARRARARRGIPRGHRLTAREVMDFLKRRYGVEVVE